MIIVDALFGTGLTRSLTGELGDFVKALADAPADSRGLVVSVDIPSGVCADSGKILGVAVPADLVVSFHCAKQGHYLADAPELARDVMVKSIGLPVDAKDPAGQTVLVDDTHAMRVGKIAFGREASRHKYDHGHAMILSGPAGKGGAARLAARGALRIGAGLVTLGCRADALPENAARLDAVMLAAIDHAEALVHEISSRKIRALCIGPGFGVGDRLRKFLQVALQEGERARSTQDRGMRLVLDADALSAFRDEPETLFEILHEGCVITPHEGEFGRLFPDILAKLNAPAVKGPAYSKVDATRDAARRAGCVVLFKGADTVIADPAGRCAINAAHYDRSAPWLATAGSGDVLAGFITGLLARGFAPMQAAETAARLHVECALKFGPGLIAEDIPEQLPAVFQDLGL